MNRDLRTSDGKPNYVKLNQLADQAFPGVMNAQGIVWQIYLNEVNLLKSTGGVVGNDLAHSQAFMNTYSFLRDVIDSVNAQNEIQEARAAA